MTLDWIKITLSSMGLMPFGMYPCIHGRIEELPAELEATEENLNVVMSLNQPFKLFDPILLTPRPSEQGVQMGASALCENSTPPIENDYIWVNPTSVTVWTSFEANDDWKNLVASTIHGIELAGPGEIPDDYSGPSIFQP